MRLLAPVLHRWSFDDLIRAAEQRRRDGETKRLRRFEVDYQLDFGGLDRQDRWLLALKNGTGVVASQAIGICNTAAVASEPASKRPCERRATETRDQFASMHTPPVKTTLCAAASLALCDRATSKK